MVDTDIAARGIHIDGIDLVIHADPPAEHKAYVHRSGRTARGGADGVVVTLQSKAQARDVTAMMRKADITPHTAVTVDPDSDEIAEIAGPPAPRVSVSGKVSELVGPEDRLARNDGPGGGKPWEGRPRRDRNGDRGRGGKPREDRFRDRGPRDASSGPAARRDRDDRGRDNGYRGERASGGDRQSADGRPSRDSRDERPFRAARPQAGRGRPEAGGQQFRPRTERTDRPQAGGHFGGSSKRAGYSAGRGAAGKRRDSGQGRHF
jgi:superfamily II DNA/RNA helicase